LLRQGIEDQNVGADLIVEAGHDGVHVDHRVGHLGPGLKLDVDRHQIVAAIDLHAMAGVIDEGYLRAYRLQQEIADRLLHCVAVEIEAFRDGKSDITQASRDRMRIVRRIGQRLDVRIGAVADHQRHAPADCCRL
jgi:hypothetical protein